MTLVKRVVTACSHTDRKYYAFGLCKYCWKREYYKRKPAKDAARKATLLRYYERTRKQTLARQRKCYASHLQYSRDQAYGYRLMRFFGLTFDEYQTKVAAQNGLCAICCRPSVKKRLTVDHNHTTEQIRGLLCHRCNLVLGLIEESDTLALALAAYLNKWELKCLPSNPHSS